MNKDNREFFEGETVQEEEPGFFKKVGKSIKEHPGQFVLVLLGALVGGVAVNGQKNKEIKKIEKVNNTLIDEAYDRGRIDGTLDTYDKILITKSISD